MKIISAKESIKIVNFVEYVIENYKEKGQTYEFEIVLEDRYDKKTLENREHSLNNKVLVQHNDGFDVLTSDLINNYQAFNELLVALSGDENCLKDVSSENFGELLIHYHIKFIDNEHEHHFQFTFLDLKKQ